MAASRSSEINLYAAENKADNSLKFRMAVSGTDVEQVGVQDYKMDFKAFKLKGENDGSYWDLETRFSAAETDISTNQNANSGDIQTLQANLAAEINDRISGDTTIQNGLTAETNARVAAVNSVAADLATQVAVQVADRNASNALIAQEAVDRSNAVQTEAATRQGQIDVLTNNFNNLLSNTSPEAVDSISELIAAYQSGDNTLANQAADMLLRIGNLETMVNALLAQNLP